jgi:hypothetical protein
MPPLPPRYECDTCQDWGTVIAPSGKGTLPCPHCNPKAKTPQLSSPKR